MPVSSEDNRFYLSLTLLGFIGTFGSIIATNYLGLHFELFSGQLQRWNLGNNPFVIFLCLGLFFLVKSHSFNNREVNYISSLSLFVYVIHENYLIRKFIRPTIWQHVYSSYGYDHILLWVVIISIAFVVASFVLSALFKEISNRYVRLVGDRYITL